ncbi:MAG: hypothetical protein GY754_02720 [bacterium]|nr:hypothetical protein [bacterium]
MKKKNLPVILLVIAISIVSQSGLFAKPTINSQDTKGSADNTLFKSDSIHLDKHTQGEGTNLHKQRRRITTTPSMFSLTAQMYYSEYYKIYSLPLGFYINDVFAINLTIPLVTVQFETDTAEYS